jgi:hypothetical protein
VCGGAVVWLYQTKGEVAPCCGDEWSLVVILDLLDMLDKEFCRGGYGAEEAQLGFWVDYKRGRNIVHCEGIFWFLPRHPLPKELNNLGETLSQCWNGGLGHCWQFNCLAQSLPESGMLLALICLAQSVPQIILVNGTAELLAFFLLGRLLVCLM